MTNAVLLNVLRRYGVYGTVHGFRTSFRSWAAEEGVDRQVAEMAIAHAVKGVEGAYQPSELFETLSAAQRSPFLATCHPTTSLAQ